MKRLLLSLVLTVACALPAFSQTMDMPGRGQWGGSGPMMGMGGYMDGMCDMMDTCLAQADKLGLTDDQVMKMKPVHREMQKKQARFRADLKIAQIDLMEIMDVKDFDLEKASAQVKQMGDLKTAHHLDMLKSMKEIRAILTEDQFRKMQKMMPMKSGGKKPGKKMMRK